jgi:hypothetical protein
MWRAAHASHELIADAAVLRHDADAAFARPLAAQRTSPMDNTALSKTVLL